MESSCYNKNVPEQREQLQFKFDASSGRVGFDESQLKLRAERAIGEYLSRRRRIWPEMPMARILKALERQGISAELAPRALELIGAVVTRVPEYVAKYNYRVTFGRDVLERCQQAYEKEKDS
jgi:hypothetical protein